MLATGCSSECERPSAAAAEFSVSIDGQDVGIDDRVFDERQWYSEDGLDPLGLVEAGALPIDSECEVLEDATSEGRISLMCDDALGVSRTIDITVSADPSPTLAPLGATVEFEYAFDHEPSPLEVGVPPTVGHAFAIRSGGQLVMAGIAGRFEVGSSAHALTLFEGEVGWQPQGGGCSAEFTDDNKCFGLRPMDMRVELSGEATVVRSGAGADAGGYAVRVDRAESLEEYTGRSATVPRAYTCSNHGAPPLEYHRALIARTAP